MNRRDKVPEKKANVVEIGNLPINNSGNNDSKDDPGTWGEKMEVKIEKVQEMFATHLEELKNREEPNTGGNQ